MGVGYVGLVTGVCLAEIGNKVVCIDNNVEKINSLNNGIAPIFEANLEDLMRKNKSENRISYSMNYKKEYKNADIIIIAVGTPEKIDGSANLDYIFEVAQQIAENIEKDTLVVIKSTVPIGTNDKIEAYLKANIVNPVHIEVASNPEFLSQGTAIKDTLNASRIILGTESDWARERLTSIYEHFNQPMVVTSRRSAEMIKYAANDFLALKISFVNDIANLCELVGANIEDVTKGMSYDDRIGKKFLQAGIGYGGSCFPKDTKALHWLANNHGYELKTIKAAIEVNEKQKLKLVKQAKKNHGSLNGKNIAILGLTFKPGTDDLREAPSLTNINYLLEEGAIITVFDPVGMGKMKKIFQDKIVYSNSISEAIIEVDMCFILTEWSEIKNYPLENFNKLMKTPEIYDGRNCYNVREVKKKGISYYSIGR